MTTSVLVPSDRRPALLERCLLALARQGIAPDEVIVVWQADDVATRDRAEELASSLPMVVRIVHAPERGIVPAENAALGHASGEVIFLIDDDSVAPPDWVERHLAHYDDPAVGAVGGTCLNFDPLGRQFPPSAVEPFGVITPFGRIIGFLHDHPACWRDRPSRDVDHLMGSNLSLRRAAFDRFESSLRPYWQWFEVDACLQVRARGYRVRFDPTIVVEHRLHKPALAYGGGREGDLTIKVANVAYNTGFVLSKYTASAPLRWLRWWYLVGVGSQVAPGPLLLPLSIRRFGRPGRELALTWRAMACKCAGWNDGRRRRGSRDRVPSPWVVNLKPTRGTAT